MIREVRRLRQKNQQEKARKEARKHTLDRLPFPEQRRAYIAKCRAEDQAAAQAKKEEAALRRREIAEMPPEERKEAIREDRFQRKLQRMASPSYIPVQVLKYTALAALAACAVYLCVIAYGVFIDNSFAFSNTGNAVSHNPRQSNSIIASDGTDPYSMLLSQADLDFMKNRVNILVMGIDRDEGRADWGTFRTDTMLLISINFETNEAHIISLPRDSYVWIYNEDYRGKLNGAFSAGGGMNGDGFEYAMNTVSMLLGGVPVNHYVCFDMEVVMDVVDAMGGIDYDVDVSFDLDGRTLGEGFQHLNGQQVLDYCRVREHVTGGTDIARTARQRKMIMAIFAYMKENGQLQDIPAIYSAVASNIFTDLTFEQITSLAAFSLKLNPEDLHDHLLPGKYLDMEGASFWGIDQEKKRDMIYEIFGQTIQTDSGDDVDTLLAFVAEKKQSITDGQAALTTVNRYVTANRSLISSDLYSRYESLKKVLEDAMAARNPEDIESTISPITEATEELLDWFENTLKPAVEAATPTPTPEPSESAPPSGTPSDTASQP
ncbi:MAG: LCP family protein [Bacillota bacterium]